MAASKSQNTPYVPAGQLVHGSAPEPVCSVQLEHVGDDAASNPTAHRHTDERHAP